MENYFWKLLYAIFFTSCLPLIFTVPGADVDIIYSNISTYTVAYLTSDNNLQQIKNSNCGKTWTLITLEMFLFSFSKIKMKINF